MSFHPPIRPAPPKGTAPAPAKTWYEELLEKDELLLYITAFLGVILPGLVYFIYQRVHKVYLKYAQKKMDEKRKERTAKNKIAIISLLSEDSELNELKKQLEECFQNHTGVEYEMWSVSSLKASDFSKFKGLGIFLVQTVDGQAGDESQWFIEWLEDVAADKKLKKNSNFESIRFCVAAFGSSLEKEKLFNKAGKTLQKRMKILGSTQMMPLELFDTASGDYTTELHEHFETWLLDLFSALEHSMEVGSDVEYDSQYEHSEEEEEEVDVDDEELTSEEETEKTGNTKKVR
ncbi:unnamed protein product [Auanema sp. JU1783]|nr:unnamed protein product [Auanema sp. JU1783]